MKRCLLLLSTILLFFTQVAHSQFQDSVLQAYSSNYKQEKLHVHFDKDAYVPGETVWMKAYILANNKPSNLSHTIYFDWTDVNGNLLSHVAAPVINGTAASSFSIPTNFTNNAIHCKAYTQWMLNFDHEFLFNKNIAILVPWNGIDEDAQKHPVALRFFPEGGELVAGLSSGLAFEVMDGTGKPVHARGVIKNGSGTNVDSFVTIHNGMGLLNFRPLPNQQYTAYWEDENGDGHSTPLPEFKPAGAVMHVQTGETNIRVQLERTTDAPENFKSLLLVATCNQDIIYKTTIDLSGTVSGNAFIPVSKVPGNIVQLTVFDSKLSPYAERVIFLNAHAFESNTRLKAEVTNLMPKGKNEISIEIPDSLDGNFSVSVTDGGLAYDAGNNIFSDLLMVNDIKGNVINPAFYFSNSDSAAYYADLVMRTHGWRRFVWQDVLAQKLPALPYSPESEYITLKGKIDRQKFPAMPGDSISLLAVTGAGKKLVLNLPVDEDGSFTQNELLFYDSLQVVYKPNHGARIPMNSGISIETNLLAADRTYQKAQAPTFEWMKVPDVILNKEVSGLIEELNSYSKLNPGNDYVFMPNVNVKQDSLKRARETAAHYLVDNFPSLHFPVAAIKNDAVKPGAVQYASYNTPQKSATPKSNILLSLDGEEVTLDQLKAVTMKDILFIKFLEKNVNSRGLPVLAITTRLADQIKTIVANRTGTTAITGYTPVKEFYTAAYTGTPADNVITDYRSTLYWNPAVVLDKKQRNIRLTFYNNDISTKLRVIVEGMNKNGKLTRIEQYIK